MDVIGTISRSLASKELRAQLPLRRIVIDSVYPRRRFVDPADGRKSLFGSSVKNRYSDFPDGREPHYSTHDPTKNVLDACRMAVVRRYLSELLDVAG